MQRQSACKHYVKVRADHLLNGHIRPLMFRTEDGPAVLIDAVEDEREAPALKAGGQGTRYVCRIGEQRVYLFHDEPMWFIEADQEQAARLWSEHTPEG